MKNSATPIEIKGDVAIMVVDGYICEFDAADVPLVAGFRWVAQRRKRGGAYVKRWARETKSYVYIHRLLSGVGSTEEADHIDRDPLNNRRNNLRAATRQKNQWNHGLRLDNTSGYRGVCWYKSRRKWIASISVGGRAVHLGYFATAEAAADAYDAASANLHGEYGCTNATLRAA